MKEPLHIRTTDDTIDSVLPTTGWLYEYVEFCRTLEACPRFKFFSAACAMGAAINNRVWIQRGDEGLLPKLFPNVWVMLLAPPGRGHKTSTINMAVNCLTAACPDVRILADKLTPESLVKTLSEPVSNKEVIRIGPRDATGLVKAAELSVFFGKQQYNTGLVSLVTDLYDYREEWCSDTIMRGRNVLRNVCISIIGGSTPDWLQTMLPQDAFTGGFMSRFVIVEMPATYFKRKAFPERADTGGGWESLVKGLAEIGRMSGPIEWSKGAREYYIEYYENLRPSGDVQRDAYQEREAEQILKTAMLLALSQGRCTLSETDVSHARTILDALMKETAPRIDRLTTHPRMSLVQEVQDLLKRFGRLSEREMIKKVYRSLSQGEGQFHEAIRVLKLAGLIEDVGGKSERIYVLTKQEGPGS